jgi:hypothetical protein
MQSGRHAATSLKVLFLLVFCLLTFTDLGLADKLLLLLIRFLVET